MAFKKTINQLRLEAHIHENKIKTVQTQTHMYMQKQAHIGDMNICIFTTVNVWSK